MLQKKGLYFDERTVLLNLIQCVYDMHYAYINSDAIKLTAKFRNIRLSSAKESRRFRNRADAHAGILQREEIRLPKTFSSKRTRMYCGVNYFSVI